MFPERYHKYSDWEETARRKGYEIEIEEPKAIAHSHGIERGIYEFHYGGAGLGWFEE